MTFKSGRTGRTELVEDRMDWRRQEGKGGDNQEMTTISQRK